MNDTKFYRSLIRVCEFNKQDGYVDVIVPGWNIKAKIRIDSMNIPEEIREIMNTGVRLHAKVNIGVEKKEDILFIEWEKD